MRRSIRGWGQGLVDRTHEYRAGVYYQNELYVTVGKSVACKGVVCFVGVTRESI